MCGNDKHKLTVQSHCDGLSKRVGGLLKRRGDKHIFKQKKTVNKSRIY